MKPRGLNSIPIFKINEGSKGFYELGDQKNIQNSDLIAKGFLFT
jgi:hypothetical protein